MRLCGISSCFQLVSPGTGQVAHALLTRPPLSHKPFIPEGNPCKCFVRLACVRHAASVHPEPGSNSHVLVCPASHLASSFCFLDYCFWLSFFVLMSEIPALLGLSRPPFAASGFPRFLEFSGLHYCLFVKVQVLWLVAFLSGNSDRISYLVRFVNNFF